MKMKTLLLPLDERPCNYNYPQMLGNGCDDIELAMPSPSILGDKKIPGDVSKINAFLLEHAADYQNAVLSIDMLVYGGLIPSRLHHLTETEAIARIEVLRGLKKANPNLIIYAFNCIMRTPQYSSSDEEPDYYADYGFELFRRKYLLDSKDRNGLDAVQEAELASIKIPDDIINDYETRRVLNTVINLKVVDYLEEGIIDFLVVPQDDSSPYGYTAISQKQVIDAITKKGLELKAMVYPGADEVALSLLARAYNEFKGVEPSFFPIFASVLGPSIIPLYEDRPMLESLKAHVRVCRAKLAYSIDQADFILAINSPGQAVQDTYDEKFDITYTSFRNLLDFSYHIKDFVMQGHKVAVCDSAFCNGGDFQFISYLDKLGVLDKLTSYAGWNTNCNTLGTTLSQACMGANMHNLLYRIIEDGCYQARVRHEVSNNDLETVFGIEDEYIEPKLHDVQKHIVKKLQACYDNLEISKKHPVAIKDIKLPWKRMFEIGMEIEQ